MVMNKEKMFEKALKEARKIQEKILNNVYYACIKATEKLYKIEINTKNSHDLNPFDAASLKLKDKSILLRYRYLELITGSDEVDQVHLAVGHELGHIALNHEFIKNVYQRVSSVLIEGDTEITDKETQENIESNLFSVALFCEHVKRPRPHLKPEKYTSEHIFKLLAGRYSITLDQVEKVMEKYL